MELDLASQVVYQRTFRYPYPGPLRLGKLLVPEPAWILKNVQVGAEELRWQKSICSNSLGKGEVKQGWKLKPEEGTHQENGEHPMLMALCGQCYSPPPQMDFEMCVHLQ